jgi:hypothetical protein
MRLRLHAPKGDGEVLAVPGFDAVPALVEANRRLLDRATFRIGGIPLNELRKQVRAEHPPELNKGPLILGGHQPELSHPGVWVKHFALSGLARKLGGGALNLIADHDVVKSTSVRLPVYTTSDSRSIALESDDFDKLGRATTFEEYVIGDRDLFVSFPARLRKLTDGWPFEPLALREWPRLDVQFPDSFRFVEWRMNSEWKWGCRNLELRVCGMSRSDSFRRFVKHIVDDLPAFQAAYNGAIREYRKFNRVRSRTHPAPELEPHEAPFWVLTPTGRKRMFITPGEPLPEQIRPRALTLTLFARLILGDFFIHGIGGGKYDEATDAIIRDYFGIEPPAYQVVSATLHLPLPGFPATDSDLEAAQRHVRDLEWNPQRNVVPPSSEDRFVMRLVADREDLAASEPPPWDRTARREWYRKLSESTAELRHHVWKQLPPAKANVSRIEAELQANAILRRRDYSWILFPESTLKPFLQRFLDV